MKELLETKRLWLKKPRPEDAPSIFQHYASDPEIPLYMTWEQHTHVKESISFVNHCIRSWQDGSEYSWTIQIKGEEVPVGMLSAQRKRSRLHIGYVLSKQYWGKGYVPEAVKKLIEVGFQDPKIFRIEAICDVDHINSAKVMQKAGMKLEGTLKKYLILPNRGKEPRDMFMYSIVKNGED